MGRGLARRPPAARAPGRHQDHPPRWRRRKEAIARVQREAEATATLRSPHTVQLYDFGLTDDGCSSR